LLVKKIKEVVKMFYVFAVIFPFYLIWQVLNLLALGINKAGMKEEDSNQLAGVLFIVFLFVIAGIGEMIK
jgi:hypothetical protein